MLRVNTIGLKTNGKKGILTSPTNKCRSTKLQNFALSSSILLKSIASNAYQLSIAPSTSNKLALSSVHHFDDALQLLGVSLKAKTI